MRALREPAGMRRGEQVPAVEGQAVFDRFADDLYYELPNDPKRLDSESFLEAGKYNAIGTNPGIWPYAQNLLLILNQLSQAPPEDRELYREVVRAQLSDAECSWLFWYCFTPDGKQRFKPLAETHALLGDWYGPRILSNVRSFVAPMPGGP